ncbi:MAG TPA: glycoside hydrolase family 31 protein [Candidatus Acidoferrum sp.]|nr:glycoside hydrolase family 31 protein [Candidatus Acidoferrum sp.]
MNSPVRHSLFLTIVLCVVCTSLPAQGWQHLGKVDRMEKRPDGVELTSGKAKVRVTFVRAGIVRVRVAPNGTFPKDQSWAIVGEAQPPTVSVKDAEAYVTVSAGDVVATIRMATLLVNFSDAHGKKVVADEPSLPMAWNGERVRVWKKMPALENYYGLGDKPGALNRRNRAFTMWNTDAYGFQESTDPIYKTIPFFLGVLGGKAYGIFFDNTYRSNFDFGIASPDYYSFGSEGGEINYYYIAGPDPGKVVRTYVDLTGHTELPPYWTLGFQQSRYSYYPEARVLEVAKTFRDKKIPADALYLDIDYQQGYAPFTINREYFPTFEKMVQELSAEGFNTVLITDLHIKHDPNHAYKPYDTGIKNDVFVKKADGSLYIGEVWPGPSVFPDFTLTRVRDWWGEQYKDFVAMGIAGFWNDMNEPALFETPTKTMPLDNRHRMDDGTSLEHRAIHNVFGMQNVRGTYDGLRKLRPNERPFVLTRAAYAGTQRYAATWSGDNSSTWNHIRMSTPLMLNMGLSGYPFVGSDIGGFAGSPPMDLLTRWIELGAFNPIYRDHTGKGTNDQEPWAGGPEQEAIRRRYIELRYRLLPYTYTAVEETTRTGLPIMRPLFLEYPQTAAFYDDDRDFLFGNDLLVEPVVTELLDPLDLNLPPGIWYDFWSAKQVTDKDTLALRPKLDELPLYVRAGAIVPMQSVIQFTGETPSGPLELRVYAGENCHGALYQDDGHSYDYQKGMFLRIAYSCAVARGGVSVTSHIEKSGFKPWWNETMVKIYGVATSPKEVRLGDTSVSGWKYDSTEHFVQFTVPDAVSDWAARVVN